MVNKKELLHQMDILDAHLRELTSKYAEVLEAIKKYNEPTLKSWKECSLGEKFTLYMLNRKLIKKTNNLKEDLLKHLASCRIVDFLLENSPEGAKVISELIADIQRINLEKLVNLK